MNKTRICKNCRYSHGGIVTLICSVNPKVYRKPYESCDEFEEKRIRGL